MLCMNSNSYAQVNFGVPSKLDAQGLQDSIFGNAVGSDKDGNPIYKSVDQIPLGDEGYVYSMGSGPIDRISLPPVPSITNQSNAVWRAGLGYSCGQFNPFANIQQAINQAKEKFKHLPQAFTSAVQESVAALPAYILNQINPTLYNTITKQLDDSFELFDMNYKSCRQIESEMSNNSGTYFDFLKTAQMQKQLKEIAKNDGSTTIDEVQRKVAETDGREGVAGVGGKMFGGANQPPLDLTQQVLVAGYNMLIKRNDTTDRSKPNYDSKNMPSMVRAFPSPQDAYEWVEKLYGVNRLQYSNNSAKPPSLSIAGTGIRYQLNARTNIIHSELNRLVNKGITRSTFFENTGITTVPAEIDSIRSMRTFTQINAIKTKAKIEAKRDIQMRLRFIRSMIENGIKEPDLSQSLLSNNAKEATYQLLMQIERDLHELANIMNEG